MNFIKKVFNENIDERTHLQFQKFSKGEFENRALMRIKYSGGKYTIYTSAEFANEFVRDMAERLGNNKTQITGAIVSTSDLTGELEFKNKKQFQGVKRYLIDTEMSGDEIIVFLDKLPKAFFALSFNVGEDKLKIKPKAPKSGKPGKKGEKPKPDFCKLITKNKEIVKSFVFEKSEFKEANINHTFLIDEIIIPDELKQEKDFAKIREMAKKKGKIIRIADIDGQIIKSEKEFAA
jgi:hypothetical protein